jgi:hypothetical protein
MKHWELVESLGQKALKQPKTLQQLYNQEPSSTAIEHDFGSSEIP